MPRVPGPDATGRKHRWRQSLLLLSLLVTSHCSPTAPSNAAEFVIDVAGERFVLRSTHQPTIELAEANLRGENSRFPLGPLRSGNGGFNQPWTWHLDPGATRFVEVAIEVCDGRPSYVETHQEEFDTYCPWGAQVVARR